MTNGVQRGRIIFNTGHAIINVRNDLISADENDDVLGAEGYGGNTIADHVEID